HRIALAMKKGRGLEAASLASSTEALSAPQWNFGIMAVSNVNPVAGSRAMALPDKDPYRPVWSIVIEPDWPVTPAMVLVLMTLVPLAGRVKSWLASRLPAGSQKRAVAATES